MQNRSCPAAPAAPVLCVDLDGTLILSDTLLESALDVLRKDPIAFLRAPLWALRGRACLKRELAARCVFDPKSLPYRRDLLRDLEDARANGRPLALVTAADRSIADAVAGHLCLFTYVYGSDPTLNLKGDSKRELLVREFGESNFDYVGDSVADLAVWKSARRAWIVGKRAADAYKLPAPVERTYSSGTNHASALFHVLRPHQWVKNILVFLPLCAAHAIHDAGLLFNAVLLFAAFSLVASAGYIVNDILDVRTDRLHPRKQSRPFASGELPLPWGAAAIPFAALGIVLGSFLPGHCGWMLAAYLVISLLYSKLLKAQPIADVTVLAFLYCLRLIAGGEAARIAISTWLFTMSGFLFLSLALAKRSAELRALTQRGAKPVCGRGYHIEDLQILNAMGVSAGYLSAMVMMIYLQSPDVLRLYRHPDWLWGVLLILLTWISRVWLLAHRGELHDDPVVFAITDTVSLALGAAIGILTVLAI